MPFDIDGDGLDDENVAMLGSTVADASSFRTPEEWGELYVYDGGISPDTTYLVWGDCGSPGNPGLSDPGSATTCIYGDTVGDPLPGGGWNACDGSVDIIDATAVIEGFQHLSNAAPIYQLDVGSTDDFGIACPPDLAADIIPDVVIVLEAFSSAADTCPGPCP